MPADRDAVVQTSEQEVLEQEAARIGQKPYCGLAISGGGIRSASFGLGVLQGLVRRGVLKKVDYLSTVSGGGYIGSSLTWFLKKNFPDGSQTGTEPENFPFGRRHVGGRTGVQRNDILDYIRQQANATKADLTKQLGVLRHQIKTLTQKASALIEKRDLVTEALNTVIGDNNRLVTEIEQLEWEKTMLDQAIENVTKENEMLRKIVKKPTPASAPAEQGN